MKVNLNNDIFSMNLKKKIMSSGKNLYSKFNLEKTSIFLKKISV